MFRIGEFSKIARVSIRQLRYYEEVGLFLPERIDPNSGYRYYSATQLPAMNRILALKGLGLTLDQITRTIHDDISNEEMEGMLLMKKAEIEKDLIEEVSRLRHVESRLKNIGNQGDGLLEDVVIKDVPDQQILSVREICPTFIECQPVIQEFIYALPSADKKENIGYFVVISHSEGFTDKDIDLEIGCFYSGVFKDKISLPEGNTMQARVLEGADTMATAVVVGSPEEFLSGYNSIGVWLEENEYQINGNEREVHLQLAEPNNENRGITEIQIPVQKKNLQESLLA